MEVILLEDVKALGKKNQVVKVSDGYARNFLFPKKLAVEATAVNKNAVEIHNKAEEDKKAHEREKALENKAAIEKIELTIKAKGSETKLFGAITVAEISEELARQYKIDIDKKKINVSSVIKTYGEYSAELRLYPEISAKIAVHVIPEG